MHTKIYKALILGAAAFACACSVGGHLGRGGVRAGVQHVSRERREAQRQEAPRPQVYKVERDSQQFFLIPTEIMENGERMASVAIQQIVVRAKARTLPERMGKVLIDFTIDLPRQLLGTCRNVVVTPYIHKYGEAYPLHEITLRGGLFSRVQQRDYWQYGTFLGRFRPDSAAARRAFGRFVKYPYAEGVRLDSVAEHPTHVCYYYSQEVPTDETSKTMQIILQGRVEALDGSRYELPPSDTLTYYISSILSFVDTTTRHKIRIIEKYATVQDRNYIQFFTNDTRVIDSLGENEVQLARIDSLMQVILTQREFNVDTLTLTASASPEGSYTRNEAIAHGRAQALHDYIARRHGRGIDTLLRVRWQAEDWPELAARIKGDPHVEHRDEIIRLIATEPDPDRRERLIRERYPADYPYIREKVYPFLRAVTIRYDLRRPDMIKDTIHLLEVDSFYMQGVDYLQRRKYAKALYHLNEYRDRNCAVALLSLGHDAQALEILRTLERSAVIEYLEAVACSRLGQKDEGRRHFLAACGMDERMQYRGNLDPEITELLKE